MFGTFQIGRCVNTDGLNIRFTNLDDIAVVYPAQLFQAFHFLQRALRQTSDFAQRFSTIGIEPDVLIIGVPTEPLFLSHSTQIGNDTTTEIDGTTIVAYHHLRGIGIAQGIQSIGLREWLHEGSNLRCFILKAGHKRTYLLGLDKGFVTLDIDDNIIFLTHFLIGFIATVSTTLMVFASHDSTTTKAFYSFIDAFIIGSNNNVCQDFLHLFIYPLYHGLSTQQSQRLGWETR